MGSYNTCVNSEKEYSEKIMNYMDSDNSIAMASGNYGNDNPGRFINNLFFSSVLGTYVQKMGYESAVL